MRFRIVAGARRDIRESTAWYNKNAGMGADFVAAVEAAFRRVETDPQTLPSTENPWPSLGRDIRRCPVVKFPFQVIFEIQSDELVVLAVAHGSRRPGYWRRRKG